MATNESAKELESLKLMLYPFQFSRTWPPPYPVEDGRKVTEIYGNAIVNEWPYEQFQKYAQENTDYANQLDAYEKAEKIRFSEWTNVVEQCNKWTLGVVSVVLQLCNQYFSQLQYLREEEFQRSQQKREAELKLALESKCKEVENLQDKILHLQKGHSALTTDASEYSEESSSSQWKSYGHIYRQAKLNGQERQNLFFTENKAKCSAAAVNPSIKVTAIQQNMATKFKPGISKAKQCRTPQSLETISDYETLDPNYFSLISTRLNKLSVDQLRKIVNCWSKRHNKVNGPPGGKRKQDLISFIIKRSPRDLLLQAVGFRSPDRMFTSLSQLMAL